VGTVTERSFNPAGLVTRTRIYAKQIDVRAYATSDAVTAALKDKGNDTATIAASDRVTFAAYDVRGQIAFGIDGVGAVVRYQHDGNGNVIVRTAYATQRSTGLPMGLDDLNKWLNQQDENQPNGITHAQHAGNQITRYWYDTADRARFTLDAEGYVHEVRFDDKNRETRSILYMAPRTHRLPNRR
jgi:hypothetical protein